MQADCPFGWSEAVTARHRGVRGAVMRKRAGAGGAAAMTGGHEEIKKKKKKFCFIVGVIEGDAFVTECFLESCHSTVGNFGRGPAFRRPRRSVVTLGLPSGGATSVFTVMAGGLKYSGRSELGEAVETAGELYSLRKLWRDELGGMWMAEEMQLVGLTCFFDSQRTLGGGMSGMASAGKSSASEAGSA
ncbi:hypothetical protein ABVT39_014562, partial [Epinephelus coioides]